MGDRPVADDTEAPHWEQKLEDVEESEMSTGGWSENLRGPGVQMENGNGSKESQK